MKGSKDYLKKKSLKLKEIKGQVRSPDNEAIFGV